MAPSALVRRHRHASCARRTPRARGSPGRGRVGSTGTSDPSPPRGDHADPALGPGHPSERHRRRHRRRRRSRVVGDSMNTTCSAVTPMSCCQVARSNSTDWAERSAPAASHSPMRRKIPSPSSAPPPPLPSAPSSTPNRTRPPSEASRCTCDAIGHGQPAGELLGLQEPGVLRREPGFGEGEHRTGVPEARRHRPRTPGAGTRRPCRPGARRRAGRPPPHGRRLRRRATLIVAAAPSRSPAAAPPPHGQAGPTRNRVPCRSGGNEPDIGRGQRPVAPITGSP